MNKLALTNFMQYAALFLKLLIPLNVLRWILIFTAVLWCVALWLRTSSDWGFLLAIPVSISGLMALLLIMLIPNQVIALASSRPVDLLGNSRHTLLVFLFVFAATTSGIFYWAITFIEELKAESCLLMVIQVMISLLVQMCVVVGSRWPNAQSLIFVLAWVWMQLAVWLLTLNPLLLMVIWAISWLLFSRWWLHWQPKKYQPNSMVMVINESQRLAATQSAGCLFQSGNARTWLGSRFFGAPDGSRSRIQRLLVGSLIFLLTPIPAFWLAGKDNFESLIRYAFIPFVIFMSVTTAQAMAVNLIRNLKSAWLYSPGEREDMLNIAWKIYMRESSIWVLLIFCLAVIVEFLWVQLRDVEIWIAALVTVILINAMSFYLTWWAYQRSSGGLFWCNLVGGVAIAMVIILFIATGLLFSLPFGWSAISITWVWFPPLIISGLFYKPVRTGFSRMNFVKEQ